MLKFLRNYKLTLLLIIFFAFFFRIWGLNSVPPSTSMDEASIGYNAYSVLKTGSDEFGEFPLISQRGYDDWRRSTYLLLVVPFIALFDLNSVSIRLPSVIMSVLTVASTYFIVLYFFKKNNELAQIAALLSAFILAINPWHIYISRLGHESNACLSFLVFGILFFLKGLKKSVHLIYSMIFFILSLISYYSGQVFFPIFGVLILIVYRKEIFAILRKDRKIQLATLVFVCILIPILTNIFSTTSLTRFDGTSTFRPEAHESLYKEMVSKRNSAVVQNDLIGTVVNNRRLYPLYVWFEGYISHFNINWLFSNNSSGIFKAPNVGLLYLWMFPFIILGIIYLLKTDKIKRKEKILLFAWFLLGPLPASIATQTPHAMRSYNFLPTWQIFTSFGIIYFLYTLGKLKNLGVIVLGIVIVTGVFYFSNNYFYVFPKTQSQSFHFALGQTLPHIASIDKNYSKIVFSNQENLYQSYMLFLYYNKYDPYLYKKQGGTISGGYNETHKFSKYEFRPIKWETESKDSLIIANPEDIPSKTKRLFEGKYKDGTIGIVVVQK